MQIYHRNMARRHSHTLPLTESEVARNYLIDAKNTAKADFVEALGVGKYNLERKEYDFSDEYVTNQEDDFKHDASNALNYIAATKSNGENSNFSLSDRPQIAEIQSAYMVTKLKFLENKTDIKYMSHSL